MIKRERVLSLLDPGTIRGYVPAAFFMPFGSVYREGAADDRHLAYFHHTGMDFVKISMSTRFRPFLRSGDLRIGPGCRAMGTTSTNVTAVREEVSAVLSQAPDRFILRADCTIPGDTDWDVIRSAVDAAHIGADDGVGSGLRWCDPNAADWHC